MRKTILIVAGCGLASGLALADPQQHEDAHDPQQGMTQDRSEYGTATEKPQSDAGYQARQSQSGEQQSPDLTELSASELEGKVVKTATGEEIGEIDAVWTSSTAPDERVATVEVGGFLGMGEKTIAIPVSDLQQLTTDDSYETSMTRGTIEAQPDFDQSGYTRESGGRQGQDAVRQDEESRY